MRSAVAGHGQIQMPSPEVAQLQDQQSLLTQALAAMLQGQWCGAPPSTQAFVSALDPSLSVDCSAPVLESDQPPVPDFSYDPAMDQPGQLYDWTCSVCSTEWVERATGSARGEDVYVNREACCQAIGYPNNVNPTYGLMDGSGAQLQRVIAEQCGLQTKQGWLNFDQAYAIYASSFGCMSGGAWYHWVAVRGVDSNGNLFIANSAPGYMGVWDTLSRADFNRLGPFSCIWAV